MAMKKRIISIFFRFSASRLMRMLWLPIGCSVLVGLWGPARVGAQDAPAERAPIFELHFDEDSLRVVRNEMRRARKAATETGLDSGRPEAASRAPSASPQTRFPFQAVANNQAKKIVWFNSDGTIRAQRSIPEGRKALVADNGAYVLLTKEKVYSERGTQQVELLDAQGSRLWETRLPSRVRLSPTGEMVVSAHEDAIEKADFSIWGPQGKLADYETGVDRISFSTDGQFLLIAERTTQDSTCVSLLNKQGQRLWQRHCDSNRTRFIERMSVFKNSQFIAFTYLNKKTPERHLVVMDRSGDILWTRPGAMKKITFAEEERLIVVLQDMVDVQDSNLDEQALAVVVLNALTGKVQRSFSLARLAGSAAYRYTMLSPLRGGNFLFGFLSEQSSKYHTKLQVLNPTGALLEERTIRTDSLGYQGLLNSKPLWSKRESTLGVSMGRIFKVFDYTQTNFPEE